MQQARIYDGNKILLATCALLYAACTCIFALTRIYSYKASLGDTGLTDQMFWNIVHQGRPLITINPPYVPQNNMGWHFSPIFYLFVPFYAWWPHWELLQGVQSLCFGFTGMILFYALKAAGAKNWQAWVGCILYWLSPFVLSAALWDLHEITFSGLFIAIALWAVCAKRFTALVLALLLLLLTKEHYGLSVIGFGFLWVWRYHEWKRGIALMIMGVLAMVLLLAWIMPMLHGGEHVMLMHSRTAMDRYSWLNDPWPEKIKTFYYLMVEGKPNKPGIAYVVLLLMCGLMLPLLAPLYLAPAVADIMANLLSTNPMPRGMGSYHSAAIMPVLIIAAYQGYRWFEKKSLPRKDLLVFGMAALALVISGAGVMVPLSVWEIKKITLSYDRASIARIQHLVADRPVTIQNNVGMFFSQRRNIYPFPHGIEQSSYVILHLYNPYLVSAWKGSDIPFGDPLYFLHVHNFMQQPGWHVNYWHAPWLVMERGKTTGNERDVRADIAQHIDSLEKEIQ